MKQVIFDKESPKGRIVEFDDVPQIEPEITDTDRIEALEAAILELAEVVLNG